MPRLGICFGQIMNSEMDKTFANWDGPFHRKWNVYLLAVQFKRRADIVVIGKRNDWVELAIGDVLGFHSIGIGWREWRRPPAVVEIDVSAMNFPIAQALPCGSSEE